VVDIPRLYEDYEMQIVRTDKGYISGTLIGEPGKEVSTFRGIP
jgi:hypothetical protein